MILLIELLAVLVFLRSWRGEFLFDDPAIWDMTAPAALDASYAERKAGGGITGVYRLPHSHAGLWRQFWNGFHKQPRALTNMTYAWTWRAWRFRPAGWHLFNLSLHAANTILVSVLACRIFHDDRALLAAAVFAVHPLQTAAVCYVSGRAALLATFFTLCAFALFLGGSWLVGLLALYLAWKSKQDAPAYVALYPVFWYFSR